MSLNCLFKLCEFLLQLQPLILVLRVGQNPLPQDSAIRYVNSLVLVIDLDLATLDKEIPVNFPILTNVFLELVLL